MTEADLYKELGILTKEKDRWKESIPYVSSQLSHESVRIQAKALWLLGEMGLVYPQSMHDVVPAIGSFLDSPEPLLRERAVNALGRIGRGSFTMIEPYWVDMFLLSSDEDSKVRLSFIWASENIATNRPDLYENHMPVFVELLHDVDDRVRMEAPEIFRVIGKRRPEFVRPHVEQLKQISETDKNRVVRIHCRGAVRATGPEQQMENNILQIDDRKDFRKWLVLHADNESECWIELKRGRPAADNQFYYIDAVEEALCFGWIDSTYKLINGRRMQRFTPRKKNSPWTELNKERVRRLEKLGLMTDAGRAVLPAMGVRSFNVDPDIVTALKQARAWSKFKSFPSLYQRVRAGNIAFYKRRNPAMYKQALLHLIVETQKGKMFGEWNDYGRLLEY